MTTPIKRHPALAMLSKDHHLGLMIAMVMKKDAPVYRGMPANPADKIPFLQAQFKTHLKPHFEKEEKILFPFVHGRNAVLEGLSSVLISEHQRLEQIINSLSGNLHPENELHEFGDLLESHIRKEERLLFQEVQVAFSEQELTELGDLLKD